MESLKKQRDPVKLEIRVEIDAHALGKLWTWVDLARGEVSMLGIVEEELDPETGRLVALRVEDFHLVDQECSSAETTMNPQGIASLLTELEQRGVPSGKVLCWAHSHGDMGVFWSGQDHSCVKGLANGSYLLSLVVNKARDTMMRLDQFHPAHLTLSDIAWSVHCPIDQETYADCFLEFQTKVGEGCQSSMLPALGTTDDIYVERLKLAKEAGRLTEEEYEEELGWFQEAGF